MKLALFARLEAKPGKEQEVADFLRQGLALANQEATTLMWFALRVGPTTFAIFDTFGDEQHAPYSHDGSAADLPAVVSRYDTFFRLGLTAEQKADLV